MESILDQGSAAQLLAVMLEEAQGAGALAAEALVESAVTVTLDAIGGKLSRSKRANRARISGFVYLDGGRTGSVRLETLDPKRLRAAVKAAIKAARSAPPIPEAGPVDRYDITTRGLGLEDPRYKHIDDEARAEVVLSNLEAADAVDGIEITDLRYADTALSRAYASTRGLEAWCSETLYNLRLDARDRHNGRRMTQTSEARHFAHVGSLPYGVDLARRLVDLREVVPLPEAELAIVMETRVMARVLELLAPAFSAPLREASGSFIQAFQSKPIGHARVHLIDDASLHGGVRTHAFDDRGVPPMPVPLIREGQLGGLYHDPESARRADVRPTGHVIDGKLRPSNLVLRPGNRSRTQMLGEVPLSLSFDHVDGSLDLGTGRFRVSGPAFVLERGQRAGVVSEAVLEGHISDLLKAVVEVASDQEREGRVDCATTLIKGFPVTAG
ncbi:MAG: hypothetical protein H6740_29160 [Alphaproteobacteria bacterium]|nr:hypothetical protein [Alphaproteobacteria bacterium]